MFDELEFSSIQLDQLGSIAVLTINRPGALNALNGETLQDIAQATEAIMDNAEIGALIVTGSGERAFVAGADITELAEMKSAFEGRELALAGQDVLQGLANLPLPTIAAINGFALGGGLELALACDLRVMSRSARVGLPEVGLGLIPGFGGTQRLPRIIGVGRALDLILTGRQITADEALQFGVVTHVADNALERARELAEAMLKHAPMSLALAKESVRRGMETDFDHALEIEADLFGLLATSKDFKEGTRAFMEKRPARFQGE